MLRAGVTDVPSIHQRSSRFLHHWKDLTCGESCHNFSVLEENNMPTYCDKNEQQFLLKRDDEFSVESC